MERFYLAALQMISGIGNARLRKLLDFFGSAQQVWRASQQEIVLSRCLDEATCNKLLHNREKIDILSLAEKWHKQGIRLCQATDSDYPALLRPIFNSPVLLYYRGTLPRTDKLIAVVGSRRASAYGKNVAHMLGRELALGGVTVVSGAARGIDSAAHQGALMEGSTIAVLGCGIDITYPPENRNLLRQIAEQGAVISEYPPGTSPHAAFFPVRNRIINGLSRGVVVVEAAEKSGALITVEYALEEGRDVFAVPGSIFSQSSKGVHQLIKQGAKLIDGAGDVFEEYGWVNSRPIASISQLSADEIIILNTLDYEIPLTIEEIMIKTNFSSSVISYALLQLELSGLVMEHCTHCYVRVKGGI